MMRMIKNYKKKHSADKKGVILVTVLFILAMAMIFISCALLLTSATRGRVYERTHKTQARLTLTSAIESFYQALQMQEITDDALETYADNNASMQVIMDDGTVPGMYQSGPGGNDNVTTAKFYNTTVGGEDYVVVDFTTKIGDATENARAFLFENSIPDPPDLFSSQVDFNGPLGNNFRGSIGKHNFSSNPADNIVVWRGDYRSNQSEGTDTYSDMLFIGGNGTGEKNAYFENNEHIHGDLIFLDNYKMAWNSTSPTLDGDVYFLGPGGKTGSFMTRNGEAVGSASRSYAKSTSTWLFANRTANAGSNKNNVFGMLSGSKDTLFLKNSGGSWDSSMASELNGANNYSTKMTEWQGHLSSHTAQINKAKKFYTTDHSDLVQVYPTTSQMKSQYGMPISAADCTGYTTMSFNSMISSYNGQLLPAGNYLVQGDGGYVGLQMSDSTVPYVVCLDGASDYMFFINETVNLSGVVFAVVNPSQDHHQYFIVAPGCNLIISHDNNNTSPAKVCAGFMSVNRTGSTDAATYAGNIGSLKLSTAKGAYNGVQKPTIQIYCMNNNELWFKRGTICEAYIGMFQNSYNSSNSTVYAKNANNGQYAFYGRIMATNIVNDSGDFDMPYCPAPNVHNVEEYSEMSSKYKVASLQYYYGNSEIPSEG